LTQRYVETTGITESMGLQPVALPSQTIGNVGLYYVCHQMSRLGWNVMPTARNARGVDVVGYSHDGSRKLTLQVKALTKRSAVPLGGKLDHLFADWVVVCRGVLGETQAFVLTPMEVRSLATRTERNGRVSYWLEPKAYENREFAAAWSRIGSGL
jgi:hypothetical protein